jgi:hypothetical protein
MSTLSVHDLQGFSTYSNTVRVPSGHKLSIDENLKIPVWTNATRPSSPETGMIGFNTTSGTSEVYDGTQWAPMGASLIGSSAAYPATSARQIQELRPNAPSGTYYIDWGGTVYPIHCEMQLNGGGWMMILNYVHLGGTNPDLNARTNSFPLLNRAYTFGDESGSQYWGHTANSLADDYNWTEYMFYARTSFHSRVIHFAGNDVDIVSYIKTGSGSMNPSYADATTNYNVELRENASIPFYVNSDRSGYSNQGDSAMTNFPIYGNSTIGNPRAHWGIKGGGDRWEVDDYAGAQGAANNYAESTIHRIWVR